MFNALLAVMLMQAPAATNDVCSGVVPPPAELSGWASLSPLDGGRTATGATVLTPGVAVVARLPFTRDVRYIV